MSNQIITISQLHATPNGTYVNGPVEGWLVQIRPPSGKMPAKAKLQEGPATIDVTLWGGDCSHWEGKRVRFSGKGMKVTDFRGTKQLSVGQTVVISAADAIAGDPEPRQPSGASQTRHSPQTPPTSQGNRVGEPTTFPATVHPATVGMCMKMAGDFLLREDGWQNDTANRLETIASQLIAVAQRLEKPDENPF